MRRRPRLLTVCLAAVALSACAGGPEPSRVATAVTGADRTFQGESQSDWPTAAWWKALGDPQLDALIDEALNDSPTLAEAAARVRTAQALTAEAAAASLPKISGYTSYTEVKADFPPILHGYNDAGILLLNFGWDLDFFGRNRAAVAAAISDSRAATAESAEARLGLTTSIAATYADLVGLYAERDVAERALAVRQETEALVVKRVDNGLDTRAELSQAQAGAPAARADLAALDEQIAITHDALAALAGAGPDRGLSIQRPSAPTLRPFGLPDRLAVDLIGRRPDIVAAKWRAEAATHRVDEAKRAFYPDINLTASVGQGRSVWINSSRADRPWASADRRSACRSSRAAAFAPPCMAPGLRTTPPSPVTMRSSPRRCAKSPTRSRASVRWGRASPNRAPPWPQTRMPSHSPLAL